MRRTDILIIIACCMTLLSCQKTYLLTLEGKDEHRIEMFCATGTIDSTAIIIEAVAGINGQPLPDAGDAEIVFKVNGQEQDIEFREPSIISSDFKDMDRYYVMSRRLQPGDNVSIDIRLEGAAPIHAQTIVPPAPEVPEVLYDEKKNRITQISYSERDPDACFGLRILSRHESWSSELINGEWTDSDPYITWNSTYGLGNDTDIMLVFNDVEYPKRISTGMGDMCFWRNDMISEDENGRKIMDLDVGPAMGNWEIVGEDFIEYGREYLVIYFYRLSEELFTFYDIATYINEDVLGDMGLSPVHYSYTNVKGGFGVLGGISESTLTIPVE